MNRHTFNILLIHCFIIANLMVMVSCRDIKKNKEETDPAGTFITIYENNNFSKSFIPTDIKQTSDGGYLILAKRRITESSFYGVYLMKTDKTGKFISGQEVSTDIVNPTYNLMQAGQKFYFFAMDRLTLEIKLMSASENAIAKEVSTLTGELYPLYASLSETGNEFILQHYNRDDLKTVISLVSINGNINAQRSFDIGFGDFDVEEPIIDHFTGNGKKLPFLAGSAGNGTYFFNGFYNYTLSTVFFSFNTATPGLLQGYKDEKCLSSLLFLRNNTFAVSKYAYGTNTFAPKATINNSSGAIASNSSLTGNTMLELNPDAQVFTKRISISGRNVIAYNSDTKNQQIALYIYDENTGGLIGVKHYGFANPYTAGNLIQTNDGGLAILGTTYVAGRFPRIVLIKIAKEELQKITQ